MLVSIQPLSPLAESTAPVPTALLALFDAANRGRPLERAVEQIIKPFGFDTFFFGMTTAENLKTESRYYYSTNASLQRIAEYDQRSYIEIDPRLVHAWNSMTPFIWDRRVSEGDVKVERFLEEAATYWGVGSGICVPLRGDFHSRSVFAVNAAKRDVDSETAKTWAGLLGDIVLLAMHFHDTFVRTVIDRGIAPTQQGAPLSSREIQCLQFAAHGLTSSDIAQRLGLVERTVSFHFANIISKLAAANRAEAVAIATARQIIAR